MIQFSFYLLLFLILLRVFHVYRIPLCFSYQLVATWYSLIRESAITYNKWNFIHEYISSQNWLAKVTYLIGKAGRIQGRGEDIGWTHTTCFLWPPRVSRLTTLLGPPGASHRARASVASCWIASLRSSHEHRSCDKPNRRFLLWWVGNRLRELVTGAGAHRPEGANRGSPTGSTSRADHLPLTSSLLLPTIIWGVVLSVPITQVGNFAQQSEHQLSNSFATHPLCFHSFAWTGRTVHLLQLPLGSYIALYWHHRKKTL